MLSCMTHNYNQHTHNADEILNMPIIDTDKMHPIL